MSKKQPKAKPKKNSKTKSSPTLVKRITTKLSDLFASEPTDIVAAIEMDHQSLRNFLDILKDTDRDMTERRRAYASFSALLKSHTIAEEKAVYAAVMKLAGREMHLKVTEGFVEHTLSDDLMKRLDTVRDAMKWSAHANVLAEIVAHHLKEEERDLMPLIEDAASDDDNQRMLKQFERLRGQSQKKINKKNAGVLR